jgi:conjugative transfer pilus assembly protein TraH
LTIATKADFQGADGESLMAWRESLYRQRDIFTDLASATSQRFDRTMAVIQKSQFLEKTLKAQMSPAMAGSLHFSRTLSDQLQ